MIILHKYPFSSSFCCTREHSADVVSIAYFLSHPHPIQVPSVCSYHDHKFQFKYWFHCCCHRLRLLLPGCNQHRSHSISHSLRNGQNYHIHSWALYCACDCVSVGVCVFGFRMRVCHRHSTKTELFSSIAFELKFVVRCLRSLHGLSRCAPIW